MSAAAENLLQALSSTAATEACVSLFVPPHASLGRRARSAAKGPRCSLLESLSRTSSASTAHASPNAQSRRP